MSGNIVFFMSMILRKAVSGTSVLVAHRFDRLLNLEPQTRYGADPGIGVGVDVGDVITKAARFDPGGHLLAPGPFIQWRLPSCWSDGCDWQEAHEPHSQEPLD